MPVTVRGGAITTLAWVFVYFLAPETKGRSLDEVHSYWEGGKAGRRQVLACYGDIPAACI